MPVLVLEGQEGRSETVQTDKLLVVERSCRAKKWVSTGWMERDTLTGY